MVATSSSSVPPKRNLLVKKVKRQTERDREKHGNFRELLLYSLSFKIWLDIVNFLLKSKKRAEILTRYERDSHLEMADPRPCRHMPNDSIIAAGVLEIHIKNKNKNKREPLSPFYYLIRLLEIFLINLANKNNIILPPLGVVDFLNYLVLPTKK